jgi:2-alkenal reductase
MSERLRVVMMSIVLALLAAYVAQPYLDRYVLSPPAPRSVAPRADLSDLERSTIQLFKSVSPSVVQVVGVSSANTGELSDQGGEGVGMRSGTGFVWDADGDIVTNNHVVEGTVSLAVRMASGETVPAHLLGTTPGYDLAVVRITSAHPLPPPLPLGRSSDLQVGQSAFAIGNPFGLDQSLTTGVISALKRRLPTSGGREIADAIQTDAAINPGNSGGPLLDSAGRLIGVNTAIYSPSGANAGIGFAIPVDVVNRIVPELIKTGRVPTPGIGIVAANEAAAARLGIRGVIVVRTAPGSPAEQAGLPGVDLANGVIGDVIVGVDGHPIQRLNDLTDSLGAVGIGRDATLTLLRNGHQISVKVRVADVGSS